MGLRIKSRSLAVLRPMATLMMVFALAVQPMYGFVASQVANATSVSGSAIQQTPQPTLSFVANHKDASGDATSSWRGISVEIKTPNLTDATKVTVKIDRTNGEPDVWVSNPNRLDAINGLNGAGHNTSAPLVIAEGTRTRTDATKSWVTTSAPWTNNQVPENVHVTVERQNGETLTGIMPVGSVWGTTWADTAANLPAPETPVVVPNKDNYTVKDDALQGWGIYYDGKTEFVTDSSAVGNGALKITTEDGDQSKMVYRSVPADQQFLLRNLDAYKLAFDTKRLDGPAHASSTYAMYVDMDGNMTTTSDREYIVYEPANNAVPGHNYDNWKTWNLNLASTYWYKANDTQIAVKGTSYIATNPNAVVIGLTINQGSGNPGWVTLVDNVVTHNGIYDFEPAAPVDTAAPEILSISPVANSAVKETQEFVVRATDESGVEKIALYIWREDSTKAKEVSLKQDTEDETRWTGSVDTATLGNGEYQLGLRVVALDGTNKVKLYNNRKESHQFTIDNANPIVRNVKLSDGVINGDEIKKNKLPMLSADVDGTGSNVDRAEYRIHTAAGEKIDGFNWVPMDAADDSFNQKNELVEKALDVNGLADGDYLVRVRAFDAADNKKSGNDVGFRVDTTQATVTIDTPQNGATVHGTQKFSLTVKDDYGVNKVAMYVNKDGTKVREFALKQSGDSDNWYYDVDTNNLAGEGEYKISFRAVDNSGNVTYVNNRLDSYSVTVDNTAPKLMYLNRFSTPELTNANELTFLVKFTEDMPNLDNSNFELKGSAIGEISAVRKDTSYADRYYVDVINVRGDGKLELNVVVAGTEDVAGNEFTGRTNGQSYTVDNTRPTAQTIAPSTDTVVRTANGMEIELKAADAIGLARFDMTLWKKGDNRSDAATMKYSWGGTVPEAPAKDHAHSFTLPSNLNLEDGEYTIYFTATDKAGNSRDAVDVHFEVDSQGPTYTASYNSATRTLSGTFEGTTGNPTLTLTQNGTDVPLVNSLVITDNTWSYVFPNSYTGQYEFALNGQDEAGNTMTQPETTSRTVTVATVPKDEASVTPDDRPTDASPSASADSSTPVTTSGPSVPGAITPLGSVLVSSFAAPAMVATPAADTAVLGDQDVLGTTDTAAPSAAASDDAESDDDADAAGMAWYWWVLIALAGIGAAWWIIAALRRRIEDEE